MKGACEAVELLELAVFYIRAIGVAKAIVVVEMSDFTAECLSSGRLVYVAYIPARWFGF